MAEPWKSSARRTVAGLVAAALALVGAVALGFVVLGGGPDHPGSSSQGQLAGFDPPVAVPRDGAFVRTEVLPSGDLKVDHWIRAKRSILQLTLTTPNVRGLDRAHVVARQVAVQADGRTVYVPRTVSVDGAADVFTAAREVHISYVLSGVLVRSGPAQDRALARVTSLDLSYKPERGPTEVSVVGFRVLALACSSPAPDAIPRPCGSEEKGAWQVVLGPDQRHDRVLAQLDLG